MCIKEDWVGPIKSTTNLFEYHNYNISELQQLSDFTLFS